VAVVRSDTGAWIHPLSSGVAGRNRAEHERDDRTHLPGGPRPGREAQQNDQHDADPGAEDEPGDDVGGQQAGWSRGESMVYTTAATLIGRMTDANARTNSSMLTPPR